MIRNKSSRDCIVVDIQEAGDYIGGEGNLELGKEDTINLLKELI